MVYLFFKSMLGDGVFVQSLTPMEPLVQKLVHNIYINWKTPIPIAKFFMLGEAIQVRNYFSFFDLLLVVEKFKNNAILEPTFAALVLPLLSLHTFVFNALRKLTRVSE